MNPEMQFESKKQISIRELLKEGRMNGEQLSETIEACVADGQTQIEEAPPELIKKADAFIKKTGVLSPEEIKELHPFYYRLYSDNIG